MIRAHLSTPGRLSPLRGPQAPRSQHRPAEAETNNDKDSPLERAPFSVRCLSGGHNHTYPTDPS
ncbi:MAG: hypothetical protein AAGF95_22410 [Chloroflexota bacterium]